MAFFGLTALGPQNTFASSEKNFRFLHIFNDNDFKAAWDRVNGVGILHCHISKLDTIMRSLFKGPVPINEEQNVKDAFRDMLFDSETSETISFTNYMRVMDRLRSDAEQFERSLEGKLKPTCQFTSLSSLQETTKRCGLVTMKLQEKQLTALTSAQQYGWERVKLERPVAGRGQSDITKFQSELIKNGVYY